MFDGINAIYKLSDSDNHILNLHLWEVLVNEQTGERMNDFKTFSKYGLIFKLKPSLNGGHILTINGSLHKWQNKGFSNSNQFYFNEVKNAVSNLCSMFDISPNEILLHGLEIGVNISLPYPVKKLLKSIVAYKGKPFTQINKSNEGKGFVCSLNEYHLKIYNKGSQGKTGEENLLRFEVSVKKMRYLKNTFATIADLTNKEKALTGIEYLQDCYNAIIWTDSTANKNLMNDREVKQWLSFSNPKTWQEMKKDSLKNSRIRWKYLLTKYGKIPDIFPIILSTWQTLFCEENKALNLPPFHQLIFINEALKVTPFSHFKCNGEKGVKINLESIEKKDGLSINENNNINNKSSTKYLPKDYQEITKKRTCKTCKKDITHQRRQSLFCSSKYVGEKQAKQCRNKKSNRKRDFKKKISKADAGNKFIAITYENEYIFYTDILHPKEFEFNKWFDTILKIEIL